VAKFWFICVRLWLKLYGKILGHLTVLIFVREVIATHLLRLYLEDLGHPRKS